MTAGVRDPLPSRLAPARLARRYREVRGFTERLAAPLSPEDCAIQSMPDASPTRWHLAHTTWFFETFLLRAAGPHSNPKRQRGAPPNHSDPRGWAGGPHHASAPSDIHACPLVLGPERQPHHPQFEYLYNSYYQAVGRQFARARRGLLSRPSLDEIRVYRAAVDAALLEWLDWLATRRGPDDWARLRGPLEVVELGLHHEQQHQELLLTDILHVFSCNPLWPSYRDTVEEGGSESPKSPHPEPRTPNPDPRIPSPASWRDGPTGAREVGHAGNGFRYDNEGPRHTTWLSPHRLADRLVTCGEYLEFIEAGGYRRPEPWLSLGWTHVEQHGWSAPLYWEREGDTWWEFTLAGRQRVDPLRPVSHVSYFEADAYARWRGCRLPTEFEWELGAGEARDADDVDLDAGELPTGNYAESGEFRPRRAAGPQWLGDLWEWTGSAYLPYPGYRAPEGALGEYNGKFMCNQQVLRGGSCATPASHIRRTYRNFFPPDARWQFMGIRLADG